MSLLPPLWSKWRSWPIVFAPQAPMLHGAPVALSWMVRSWPNVLEQMRFVPALSGSAAPLGVVDVRVAGDVDVLEPHAARPVDVQVAVHRHVDEVAPVALLDVQVAVDRGRVDLLVRAGHVALAGCVQRRLQRQVRRRVGVADGDRAAVGVEDPLLLRLRPVGERPPVDVQRDLLRLARARARRDRTARATARRTARRRARRSAGRRRPAPRRRPRRRRCSRPVNVTSRPPSFVRCDLQLREAEGRVREAEAERELAA